MIGLSIDRCAQKREKKKEANRLAEGWKRKQAMRSALSYLYSYRCMGKVGNLLARPPPSLPLPIFNPSLLLLFQRPTLAASSPAINTKNSQGQTAPPRFIAYEFSDLSIAATCLSPVTADPHLPSRASVSSAASRSSATYFPGTNAMNHACPRYECSSADIRSGCSGHDPRLLDIVHFHPVVSIRFSEGTNGVSFVRKRLNRIYLEMDGYSLLRGKKIH